MQGGLTMEIEILTKVSVAVVEGDIDLVQELTQQAIERMD